MADMLVTPTELIIRLDYADAQQPTDRAQQAIENATGMIQAATGQRFIAVANEVYVTKARANQWRLWLPERPVTAVGAVTVDGVAKTVNVDYHVDGSSLVARNTSWDGSGTWPATVSVTYSHGYATIPQALKDECLRLAALLYQNPEGHQSETIGAVSWTLGGNTNSGGGHEVSPHIITAYGALAVA